MRRKKFLLFASAALFVILACNIGSSAQPQEAPNGNIVATSVAQTLQASGQVPPPNPEMPTPLPAMTFTPLASPTATLTPTITLTPTPAVPMVSVSVSTNCRTGPGEIYDYIGALLVGEKAEVVGKKTSYNYWIIKNPDASGNCWLWGQYATVVGNTDNLQEFAVPPTPTPAIPVAPSKLAVTKKENVVVAAPNCTADITLTWDDNSENEGGFNLYQDAVKIASYESSAGKSQLSVTVNVTSQNGVAYELGVTSFNVTGESARSVVQVTCP